MFSESCVSTIELLAPQSSIDALAIDPRGEYQPATLTLDSCGLGSDIHGPVPVTIRLKGSYSFRTLDGKAAFKIKFAKANRPDGLRSFTLNNMVQDPSSSHELLGYGAFRRLGLVAPRVGYARLRFNGSDFGLYANVETIDQRFADDHFESTGHIFEAPSVRDGHGSFASRDILPASAANFELDEGDEHEVGDLVELAAVSEIEDDGQWWTELQSHVDTTRLLRLWAAISYYGIEDSYLSHVNNYYLHSDDDGFFTMIASGIDQAFQRVNFPSGSSILHFPLDPEPVAATMPNRCFAVTVCRAAYIEQLHQVARSTLEGVDLVAKVHELFALTAEHADAGRSEHTRLAQCRAANKVITSLVTREREVLGGKAALWGWGDIDSDQSSASVDCTPFEPPVGPTIPTPPVPAPTSPSASSIGSKRLRSGRGQSARYRLSVRAVIPAGESWTLSIRGSYKTIVRRNLTSADHSVIVRTNGELLWVRVTDMLNRNSRWYRLRLNK